MKTDTFISKKLIITFLNDLENTGILVMMIGLNLLNLKDIKTGNFLPSLALILAFALLEPVVKSFMPI